MLTVLSIALDPFAQQLLQYRQTTVLVRDELSRVRIMRAGRYSLGMEVRLSLVRLNCKRLALSLPPLLLTRGSYRGQ